MESNPGIFIIQKDELRGLESRTAVRVLRRLMHREGKDRADLYEIDTESPATISDMAVYDRYEIFVFICGNVLLTGESVDLLSKAATLRQDLFMIAPVANLTRIPQQFQAPPFFYQSIPAFRWGVEEIQGQFHDEVVEVDAIDDFCFAMRRDLLKDLPGDALLTQIPKMIGKGNHRYGIAKGAYAHRYGDLYESAREDLLPLVPLNAIDILDIGCARGRFGEVLKNRQRCRVTGLDSDGALLDIAQTRLDNVIAGDIEKVVDGGISGRFDCIVCGDVLEHVNDPWQVVIGLRRYLKMGGMVVASVPNVANWAVVYEMLHGRWDYVPFTILSGTHLRFFTKDTLRECFEDAGYRITNLYFQSFGLPPEGAEFIDRLKMGMATIDEEALKASEIVIAAARD
jgi:2-polyprenyl-3-methyl-5-hydroxy-6-metoxy-1,4-benzoquinol methylase